MAPKRSKGKTMDSVDGVDTSKMTREQLELYSHKILEEMEREREERNYFQLERDNIRRYWEITRHQLEEAKSEIRNKERKNEELAEKHEKEIKLFKQKVKYLMYEHQTNLSETKAEQMVALKLSQDDHIEQENHLLKDKEDFRKLMKEQELAHVNEVRGLRMNSTKDMTELIQKFESEAMELEKKYEEKFSSQYESMHLQKQMEITEVEERKNMQISSLIKNHEKAFAEMKTYYNDITLNNLSLIQSLKEIKKQVRDLTGENKKLLTDSKNCEEQLSELNRQLTYYGKDKLCLSNTKKKISAITKDYENLKWENEVLELRFNKCQHERDELHSRFVSSILEVQKKSGLKNVILEKKLEKLSKLLEERDIHIQQVVNDGKLRT
ncbi:hypothetical protein HCN44_011015 [Aphidius gifuensis]|uniref:Dynein regulatory complex subunit 4 n=1 Tax=Aphidius gifuensis TaxID=684658 RepID=A0A834Y6A7_APHGI|nr:hypothetical protein HCN44_011015 [Aphidius gifuensis]